MVEVIATTAVAIVVVVGFTWRPARWLIERLLAHRLAVRRLKIEAALARHAVEVDALLAGRSANNDHAGTTR